MLIADDHTIVREGLVSLIKRKADMMVVGKPAMVAKLSSFGKSIGPT